jgi:uncharacterized protein YihD (DUF1040 family)
MRDKARIEPFLKKLQLVWEKNSDLRFGQLIYTVAHKLEGDDIFFPEENEWCEALDKVYESYTKN